MQNTAFSDIFFLSPFAFIDQPDRPDQQTNPLPSSRSRPQPYSKRPPVHADPFSGLASGLSSNPAAAAEAEPSAANSGLTQRMSFKNCFDELHSYAGKVVEDAHRRWRARRGFEAVHKFVTTVDHSVLYGLEPEEVEECCLNTSHSLGNLNKASMGRHRLFDQVNDFSVPFAYMHLMHMMMEKIGRMPLWREVVPFFNEEIYDHYVGLYHQHFRYDQQPLERRKMLDQMLEWRLGLAYYNFLREVDFFVRLRHEHHIDLRYHVFADVYLRTDFWAPGTIISLFISNPKYKSRYSGRKLKTEDFFRSPRGVRFVNIELEKTSVYGQVWRVPDDKLAQAADAIAGNKG